MAKDPAFLFYPNDYMGGTMGMTFEEKGAYMDLLVLQFNKGAFTINQAKKVLNGSFEHLWPALMEKFLEKDGRYFNERLEVEKSKRAAFTESRRSNRTKKDIKNISKTYDSSHDEHMTPHMENENRNENEIKDSGKGKGAEKEKPKLAILEIPATVLEAAELNQMTHTKSGNRDFVKAQWRVFLTERMNDPPPKFRIYERDPSELNSYFLNWIRNKFPKNGTNNKHSGKPIPEKVNTGGFGDL